VKSHDLSSVFWMNITASIFRARVTQFGDVVDYMREREQLIRVVNQSQG
jgi:hypothetical protein